MPSASLLPEPRAPQAPVGPERDVLVFGTIVICASRHPVSYLRSPAVRPCTMVSKEPSPEPCEWNGHLFSPYQLYSLRLRLRLTLYE